MATLLQRLGRWCAQHRWPVISTWTVLLALLVTAMLTMSKPLTNTFSMPDSRFEQVLTTLKEEIPEAAGTVGTVVIRSEAAFTPEQEAAVTDVVEAWNAIDTVSAVDPFVTQAEADAAPEQLEEVRAQLEAGEAELEAGRAEIEAGWSQLEAGEAELTTQSEPLIAAREEIEEGRAELEAQEQLLRDGQDELEAQVTELEAGVAAGMVPPAMEQQARAEIAAAQQQLMAGEAMLEQAYAQLEAGEAQLAPGEEAVAQAQAQLDQAREQLEAGEAELAAGSTELEEGRAALEVGQRMAALTGGPILVNEAHTVAMTQVSFADAEGFVDTEIADEVMRLGDTLTDAGLSIDYSKELTQDLASLMGPAEAIGLAVAAVVLLLMLGSLVAAGLPLLMALVGVGVGITGSLALTYWVEMTSVTPVLALMLGLAVGIDYSLFIINRHREQLRLGMPLRESIALAAGTSGNAVTFAGLTVIIALAALALTGFGFLAVMGFVAAATVAISVLVAITLTPAMLGLIGTRVLSRKDRAKLASGDTGEARAEEAREQDTGRGWAAVVQRHPWLAIIAVVGIAGILALPASQLRLGLPDGGAEPAASTAYRSYDTIRQEFGAGATGPIVLVAQLAEPVAEGEVALLERQVDMMEAISQIDHVQHVVPAGASADRDTLAFQVQPSGGPADVETEDLVRDLTDLQEELGATFNAEIGITGQTVANIDISEQLADAMPLYLVVVVGLSLILLLLVFRSVVIPLLATGGFLLSLIVAFGAVVAVYQLGHLGFIFDVHEPSAVLSFLPILLIGVLFGLAMDYQVFLVSAMREAHVHGTPARAAVVTGFNHSARVVTAAAIIMIAVFGGFIWAHVSMIRPIGMGLAIGVLVDAFLVRMTLTPAVMSLLGEKAWWIPRWLDRILPNVDVEGAQLQRPEANGQGTIGSAETPQATDAATNGTGGTSGTGGTDEGSAEPTAQEDAVSPSR